jgi:uncharacterized protein YggU (UPF0235/DUF167 family)
VKIRVRANAEGGEANRAVVAVLAKALGIRKIDVQIRAGATSRLKQVAVGGDPVRLGNAMRALTAAQPE